MPVPKRKTSKSRRDRRASGKFIRPQAVTACSNCQQALATHAACTNCGFYKGKKVLTTKLDRTVKRGEARQAEQAKMKAKEQSHDNTEQTSK